MSGGDEEVKVGRGKGVFGKGNIGLPEFTDEFIAIFSKGFSKDSTDVLKEDSWEIYYDGEGINLEIGGIEIRLFSLSYDVVSEKYQISEEDLKTLGKLIDFLKEIFEEKGEQLVL